jgi:hypothetical protein
MNRAPARTASARRRVAVSPAGRPARDRSCGLCSSPMAADQAYCGPCGERRCLHCGWITGMGIFCKDCR